MKRSHSRKGVDIPRPVIEKAVAEYLAKGGRITKIEAVERRPMWFIADDQEEEIVDGFSIQDIPKVG